MRIYWYWPFAREEDFAISTSALTSDDDHLLCQAIDRPGTPSSTDPRVEVRCNLADVTSDHAGTLGWAISRTRTYESRRRARRRALTEGEFDVAHIWFHNYFTDAVDLPRAKKHTSALLCNVHDVRPHQPRLPSLVLDRVLGRLYRSSGTLIIHHEDLREELADFGVDPAQIVVVPHQVPSFRTVQEPRPVPSTHHVLFFGTFRQNKGVPVFIEAIKALGSELDDVTFHFAGRGDPGIEKLVRAAASTQPNVSAEIGWITSTRKHELYDRASLVVLPYTSFSSQSGVLHDAYGHHLPVVVTDVGALGSTVREDQTGWVAEPGDPDSLAGCIRAAVGDEDSWRAAGIAAATVARERNAEKTGQRLRQLYERLLSDQ
jgi:glycosyltransferase involved in cell wall biosynthesis